MAAGPCDDNRHETVTRAPLNALCEDGIAFSQKNSYMGVPILSLGWYELAGVLYRELIESNAIVVQGEKDLGALTGND